MNTGAPVHTTILYNTFFPPAIRRNPKKNTENICGTVQTKQLKKHASTHTHTSHKNKQINTKIIRYKHVEFMCLIGVLIEYRWSTSLPPLPSPSLPISSSKFNEKIKDAPTFYFCRSQSVYFWNIFIVSMMMQQIIDGNLSFRIQLFKIYTFNDKWVKIFK